MLPVGRVETDRVRFETDTDLEVRKAIERLD
jgi:hypothetical protein